MVCISFSKPRVGPKKYFYLKTHGYTLICQAVIDSKKIFLDLFLGMLPIVLGCFDALAFINLL